MWQGDGKVQKEIICNIGMIKLKVARRNHLVGHKY